jgi:hypothetical protein
MSRRTKKSKKKRDAPMPSASAGLIRFYQDNFSTIDTTGYHTIWLTVTPLQD